MALGRVVRDARTPESLGDNVDGLRTYGQSWQSLWVTVVSYARGRRPETGRWWAHLPAMMTDMDLKVQKYDLEEVWGVGEVGAVDCLNINTGTGRCGRPRVEAFWWGLTASMFLRLIGLAMSKFLKVRNFLSLYYSTIIHQALDTSTTRANIFIHSDTSPMACCILFWSHSSWPTIPAQLQLL